MSSVHASHGLLKSIFLDFKNIIFLGVFQTKSKMVVK